MGNDADAGYPSQDVAIGLPLAADLIQMQLFAAGKGDLTMTKKKWLIVAVLGMALCLMAVVAVGILLFVMQGGLFVDRSLPVYTTEQVASVHSGYRRTTVSFGGAVYVSDYEEYSLRLIDPEPTHMVGLAAFGGGKICSIPGQNPAAYLAVDCGSEMPAYEVFRNIQQPPFDWRNATFQKLQLAMLTGPAANKTTTDAGVIEDVLRTLKEGALTTAPSAWVTNTYGVWLFSDQLPGLVFSPSIYIDQTGTVYLAENFTSDNSTPLKVQARWVHASPLFTKWTQTR
jgi:hypothetical protein